IELGAVRVGLETGAARTRPAVVSGLEIVEEISGEERQRAERAKQRVLGRVHIAPGVSAVELYLPPTPLLLRLHNNAPQLRPEGLQQMWESSPVGRARVTAVPGKETRVAIAVH
ncbi:MAG: hypothetical protein KDC87_20490, partial [Planctomycetes bacterium]|nr:hypothetical protein [Planctomycetota bacterium]